MTHIDSEDTFVVIQQRSPTKEGGTGYRVGDARLEELIAEAHREGRAVFRSMTREEVSELTVLLGDKDVRMFPIRFKRL